MKSCHGNDICPNFLLKRFKKKIMFSQPVTVQLMWKELQKREMETPSTPSEEYFFNRPTIFQAVRKELRVQPQTPQVEGLSSQQLQLEELIGLQRDQIKQINYVPMGLVTLSKTLMNTCVKSLLYLPKILNKYKEMTHIKENLGKGTVFKL